MARLSLEELQIEAVRGVIEELLDGSPTDDLRRWAMNAIGEISRILDMTEPMAVTGVLIDQDQRRDERRAT